MAKAVLAIPEESVAQVVAIIRAGLDALSKREVRLGREIESELRRWCASELAYSKNKKATHDFDWEMIMGDQTGGVNDGETTDRLEHMVTG